MQAGCAAVHMEDQVCAVRDKISFHKRFGIIFFAPAGVKKALFAPGKTRFGPAARFLVPLRIFYSR